MFMLVTGTRVVFQVHDCYLGVERYMKLIYVGRVYPEMGR